MVSQKEGVSRYASDPDQLSGLITLISATISLLFLYPGSRKRPSQTLPNEETQDLRPQVTFEATWCEYYSWIKTTFPFLRRSRFLLALKVSTVLLPISSGLLLPSIPLYSFFTMCLVSLAFLALLYYWSGSSTSDDYKKWMCIKVKSSV
jgi:hypothetical protein